MLNYKDFLEKLKSETFCPERFMIELALSGEMPYVSKHTFTDLIAYFFSSPKYEYNLFSTFCSVVSDTNYFSKLIRGYRLNNINSVCDFVDMCLSKWTKTSEFDYARYFSLNYFNGCFWPDEWNMNWNNAKYDWRRSYVSELLKSILSNTEIKWS